MSEMRTTTDALKWALEVIANANKLDWVVVFDKDAFNRTFTRAKEILALSEFVESDVAPDYSKDGGFEYLIDTTPAAYAMPE